MRQLAVVVSLLAACHKPGPPPPVVAESPRAAPAAAPVDERAVILAEIERGDFAAAEGRLTALIQQQPSVDLHALRATVRERLGRDDDALDDLTRALTLGADRIDLRRRRVPMLEKRAMWAELALDLDCIVAEDPAAGLRLKRAQAKARIGDHAGAVRDYDALIEKEPENDALRLDRARSILEVGDWERSIADVTHVLLKQPTAAMYGHRGHVYWRVRLEEKAVADFRKGLELDAGEPRCLVGMAEIVLKREPARCVEFATRAIAADGGAANSWFLRGMARLLLGEREKAAGDFAKAAEIDPSLKERGAQLMTVPRDQLLQEAAGG